MNGIRLLVLHAKTILFALLLSGPLLSQTVDPRTQFGWQVSKEDGLLEYIIQASPFQIQEMQRQRPDGSFRELQSDPPQWLVGRFRRVVVKIGSDVLPRELSREQIEARFPRVSNAEDEIAAVMGNTGSFRDVEPPMVNVNQGGNPSFQFPPQESNLIDSLNANTASIGDGSTSSKFLSDAQGGAQANSGLGYPGTGQTGVSQPNYNSTGSQPGSGLGQMGYPDNSGALASQSTPGLDKWKSQNSQGAVANNQRSYQGNVPALNTNSPYDLQNQGSRYLGQQSNSMQSNASSRGIQANTTPNRGGLVGQRQDQNAYLQNQNQYANPQQPNPGMYTGTTQPNYMSPGVGANSNSNPAYQQNSVNNQQPTHIASNSFPSTGQNPGTLPSTGGIAPRGQSDEEAAITQAAAKLLLQQKIDQDSKQDVASPSDLAANAKDDSSKEQIGQPAREPSELWLRVFILFSLIVNFYLVVLLRKLLTRYRTLLSSVRSQAA